MRHSRFNMADNTNIERCFLRWFLLRHIKRKSCIKNDAGRKANTFFYIHSIRKLARKRRNECLTIFFATRHRERLCWMVPRTGGWFVMMEATVDDYGWYANFRVSKKTFQFLLDQLKDEITHDNTRLRAAVPPRCRLAITLYYFASTAEYRTIANLFGVSTPFVCNCVREVSEAIVKVLKSSLIFLPKGDEIARIVDEYNEKWGFPMCCGAIDGTHIPIIAPVENHADYVNRKGFHSIVMQAVVDSSYLFRDIVVGWPGSVHDARILSNSHLYRLGNDGKLFDVNLSQDIGGTTVKPLILGDPAYPLLPWLLKPYQHHPDITASQKNFNYRLSRARMTVENTFGRWKARCRRFLKKVDMVVPKVTMAVAASCILHNLCELSQEEILDEWMEEVHTLDTANCDNNCVIQDVLVGEDASNVRDAIADYFM